MGNKLVQITETAASSPPHATIEVNEDTDSPNCLEGLLIVASQLPCSHYWALQFICGRVSTKIVFVLVASSFSLCCLPPFIFLHLPHVYIEALEPPLIDRVLLIDLSDRQHVLNSFQGEV